MTTAVSKKRSTQTTVKKTRSPLAKASTELSKHERELLKELHQDLRPLAMEMRQDEIDEVSGEVYHRWQWGKNVDEAFDEKKYGENQIAKMAEFLGKRTELLWEVRKFYRAYLDKAQLDEMLALRREDSRPLGWSVIGETLRRDLTDSARKRWLVRAAKKNMDYRTLRKAITAELKKEDNRPRGTTPAGALKTTTKQATKFQNNSQEFGTTLEERLLKGNAADFTDDVMTELETTRTSLLEMQSTIEIHLELVNSCIARGNELRGQALAAMEEETTEEAPRGGTPQTVAAPSTEKRRRVKKRVQPQGASTEEAAPRKKKKKRRPAAPVEETVVAASVTPKVLKKKRNRPEAGTPDDKIARAKKRRRRPQAPASA